LTNQFGWGGPGRNVADNYNYTPNAKNQNPNHGYDLAGNITNDGTQAMTYDATGQQATASMNAITMGYDGDGLRLKKVENGVTTYYLRSTVLGQQTVCEINGSGAWQRGYVYLGGQLLAIQDVPQNRVLWTHQEPYSKAQRITDSAGAFVSGVEVEPFGLETNRSFDWNGVNQKRKFTTYDRDSNGGDEAMFRRYAPKQDRFAQPDPYDGSYSLANPQSLNRYAYTENDPVNFVDPLGLFLSAPTQVCFQVISGTHWDFADGTRITVINERRIYCLSGGFGGGYGEPSISGGGDNSRSKGIPENCKEALEKAGLLKKVQALLNTKVIDVDKIQDEPAAKYFGNINTQGKTVGEFFDDRGSGRHAYTFRAGRTPKGAPIGITGIYARGGDKAVQGSLRLQR
jgi:RHS repeat-associated protein